MQFIFDGSLKQYKTLHILGALEINKAICSLRFHMYRNSLWNGIYKIVTS